MTVIQHVKRFWHAAYMHKDRLINDRTLLLCNEVISLCYCGVRPHTITSIFSSQGIDFFFKLMVYCWFQSEQAISRLAKFNGWKIINHRQSAETRHTRRILAQLRIEPVRTSIGIQLVDIASTLTTMLIEPRMTPMG